MPPFLARNAFKVGLALVAVALAVVIGFETNWGAGPAPLATPTGPRPLLAEAKLLPSLPKVPPEQAYPETGARPLFTPGRRPAPAGTAPGSMAKGQYTLHGVTIVDGLAIAMLKDKATGKTMRVEKGKEYNGVTIGTIEADRVTLVQGDESEVVALLVQRPAPGTSAFVPAGPFGAVAAPSGQSAVAPVAERRPDQPVQAPSTAGMTAPARTAPAPAPAPTPTASMNDRLDAARARRAQRFQQQQDAAKPENVQK